MRKIIRKVTTDTSATEHLERFVETGDVKEIDDIISSVEVKTDTVKVSRRDRRK